MQPQTDQSDQTERRPDDSTAPESETQSSAASAQGTRNNPELNEEKTGSRENERAEG